MRKRTLEIVLDNQTLDALELPSGGTKTIYDIGDGYVIARMNGGERLVDSEIHMSNRLKQVGLYTQDYTKVCAIINSHPESVLKMKNFTTLNTEGKQVRDRKNRESSCGDSLIFADKAHFQDITHWREVLKHIADDIYFYLINNLEFGSDAFNLVILDTEKTPAARSRTNSKIFSDLAQEIHLYFFDFGSVVYEETKTYDFIDTKGNILLDNIRSIINRLCSNITDTLFTSVFDDEFETIMQKSSSCLLIFDLLDASKEVSQTVWQELIDDVTGRINAYLANMPIEQRIEKYLTPNMTWMAEEDARHAEAMRKINEENNRLQMKLAQAKVEHELWMQKFEAEQARLDEIHKQFQAARDKREVQAEPTVEQPTMAANRPVFSRCSIQ